MKFLSATQMRWQLRAACRGPHSAAFYPPLDKEKRAEKRKREHQAKQICATCSAVSECLAYALEIGEKHGIWGGLNEIERQQLLQTPQELRNPHDPQNFYD